MKEILDVIKINNRLNEEIIQKALELENLKKRQETLEAENDEKLKEFQNLSATLSYEEKNEEDLTTRNGAIREKFNEIDENVKKDADEVSSELKRLCKLLGIKVTVEPSNNVYEVLFSLQFSESKKHKITFIYDSITEDYNRKFQAKIFNYQQQIYFLLSTSVLNIDPNHPRFEQIRTFLWETKDIQGFLTNYRNKLLTH